MTVNNSIRDKTINAAPKTLSRSERKKVEKALRKELNKKVGDEYRKSYDFAEKNGVDIDAVVDKSDRQSYLKNARRNGISEKTAKAVIKYNEMLDAAEKAEEALYKEYKKKIKDLG